MQKFQLSELLTIFKHKVPIRAIVLSLHITVSLARYSINMHHAAIFLDIMTLMLNN